MSRDSRPAILSFLKNDAFWHYARRMLRYRKTVAATIAMAFVSAGSFGAGLVGVAPVLENILKKPGKDLPAFLRSLDTY